MKYSLVIKWSDRDKCYIAVSPEFPGLHAHGDTVREAVDELLILQDGFVTAYIEDGIELPLPRLNDRN